MLFFQTSYRVFLGEPSDWNSSMINAIAIAKFRKKIVISANTVVFRSAFQLECHIMVGKSTLHNLLVSTQDLLLEASTWKTSRVELHIFFSTDCGGGGDQFPSWLVEVTDKHLPNVHLWTLHCCVDCLFAHVMVNLICFTQNFGKIETSSTTGRILVRKFAKEQKENYFIVREKDIGQKSVEDQAPIFCRLPYNSSWTDGLGRGRRLLTMCADHGAGIW